MDRFVASYHPESAFKPKACIIEHRLIAENRDDLLLVRVILPFQLQNGTLDVSEVVLATWFQGDTLFPIKTWPMHVHVCFILNKDKSETAKFLRKIWKPNIGEFY